MQVNTSDNEHYIIVSGSLDERANLPKLTEASQVIINLEQLIYLNSIGVRKWIRWMQEMSNVKSIVLEYCPSIFMKSLNSIKGVLPQNGRVISFYVPYYSDELQERKNVLFKMGTDFTEDGKITFPKILSPDGRPMEIDVIEDVYFSFFKQ
jgi:hypothetical protein